MNTTEQLLAELKNKLESGELKPETVRQVLHTTESSLSSDDVAPESQSGGLSSLFQNISMTKVLYMIGGIIALLGAGTFVVQIWSDIGSILRIFITLGFGLVLSVVGFMLLEKTSEVLSAIFQFGGGVLISTGMTVLFYETIPQHSLVFWFIGISYIFLTISYVLLYLYNTQKIFTFLIILNSILAQGFIVAALEPIYASSDATFYLVVSVWFLLYTFLYIVALQVLSKHLAWVLLAVANATAALYAAMFSMISALSAPNSDTIVYIVTIFVGISYLIVGRQSEATFTQSMRPLLYFFGSLAVLYSGFQLLTDSVVWEVLYFPIVLSMLVVSTALRSRIILVISTLAIISYIIYITSEYFADSLGWPISLVFLGLVCIGLGYVSLEINKRYITE